MNWNETEKFYGMELPENIHATRFDLRDKDVLQSAKLVENAVRGDWNTVMQMLEHGADPRLCRYSDGVTCESALYLALKAAQFPVAEALYHAGDRLDDLNVSELSDSVSVHVLGFLAHEAADGCNYFADESKPLSECIRCCLPAQAQEAMDYASQEELNLSVIMLAIHLRKHNAALYLDILADLKKHGADVAQFRKEILNYLEKIQQFPAVLRPDQTVLDQIIRIVKES